MSPFMEKQVEIQVTLGAGYFKDGADSRLLAGVPCTVEIQKHGLPSRNTARCVIHGLSAADIDTLTMLAFGPLDNVKNPVTLYAGEGEALSRVFAGDILPGGCYSLCEGRGVSLVLEAMTGFIPAITPAPPTSMGGSVRAEELVERLAGEAGLAFTPNHHSRAFADPFFTGSPLRQMEDIARGAGLELILDDDAVYLTEPGQDRGTDPIREITEETGLIGWPSFSQRGLSFRCGFMPEAGVGVLVKVGSMLPRASGVWRINSVTHRIGTGVPDAPWYTEITAGYLP